MESGMDNSVLPDNPDLAWDLGEGIDRERAIDFIMQFETTLCVYSASVEKLYSTYNIYFPREYHRKMVILPDPRHSDVQRRHRSGADDRPLHHSRRADRRAGLYRQRQEGSASATARSVRGRHAGADAQPRRRSVSAGTREAAASVVAGVLTA
jgi:hypothetical protein